MLSIATVIAVESTRQETFPKLLAASAITILLYWLAHAYSHHWSSRLSQSAGWSLSEIGTCLAREATILAGAIVPAAVLLGAWAAGARVETGVSAVLWSAVIEIELLEVATGLRRHLRLHDLLVQSLIGVLMAIGIVSLRLLVH